MHIHRKDLLCFGKSYNLLTFIAGVNVSCMKYPVRSMECLALNLSDTWISLWSSNCFEKHSNTVPSYSITTEKRFSELQTQGLPIPSMCFRLAKVDIGHKHMMLSADVQMYCSTISVKSQDDERCVCVCHAGPVGRCSVHTTW